jgi:putative transposase
VPESNYPRFVFLPLLPSTPPVAVFIISAPVGVLTNRGIIFTFAIMPYLKHNNNALFFTATILNWNSLLANNKYKQIICESLFFLVKEKRVRVYGFVIMPNHIHLIWYINEPHTREEVQRDFLKFTAQQIKNDLKKNAPSLLVEYEVNKKDRKHQIWQRNPLSVELYTRKIMEQKLNYIHRNPLSKKWKLTDDPCRYKYSSAAFYHASGESFGFLAHVNEDW